jgi:hypothetical protein
MRFIKSVEYLIFFFREKGIEYWCERKFVFLSLASFLLQRKAFSEIYWFILESHV